MLFLHFPKECPCNNHALDSIDFYFQNISLFPWICWCIRRYLTTSFLWVLIVVFTNFCGVNTPTWFNI